MWGCWDCSYSSRPTFCPTSVAEYDLILAKYDFIIPNYATGIHVWLTVEPVARWGLDMYQ